MKTKITIAVAIITTCIFAIGCADSGNKQYSTLQKEVSASEASAGNDTIASDSMAVSAIQGTNLDNRITVHKGNIQMQTSDAKQYVSQLVGMIDKLGGHTSNNEINTNQYEKTTQDFSTDSMYSILQESITAKLTMRVPVQKADSFVQQLMRMQATIIHLQLNEEDKTADYQIADGIDKYIIDKPMQINNYGVENAVTNRVAKSEITYQAKYFWCDVIINGDASIVKKPMLKPSAYRTPLYLTAWHATQKGFYILGNVLVGLLYILPIGILIFGVVYLVRKITNAKRSLHQLNIK